MRRASYPCLGLALVALLWLGACTPAQPIGASATAVPAPASLTARPAASPTPAAAQFDGAHAYQEYLLGQMKLGLLRSTGSAGGRATGDYILAQLKAANVQSTTQEFTYRGVPVRNIIGKLAVGRGPLIIVGAHYDARVHANMDRAHPDQSVPAANDGASGVAVLLELARTLDISRLHNEVWLAFFDAEDNGDYSSCDLLQVGNPGQAAGCDATLWSWSVGATYVAEHLGQKPAAVIILDMIGDADQNIYYEQNSDKDLQQEIWSIAARLGYSKQFIPQFKYSMSDDHTPFLEQGIRAVDMIDFDYPYWHTTQDTADKVSAASLERTGRVMQAWLEEQ
ncbi:MAG: M28 family peptidase [Anaerolineae bacterium]